MNTGTPIIKIHKIPHSVKNHSMNFPIFMSKTTSLLKHMTEETKLYSSEHYSCMTVVAMGQNIETYPTAQCK